MNFTQKWAAAFCLTLVVELIFGVFLLQRSEPLWRRVAVVALGQVATHPSVWFILPALALPRGSYIVFAESWAVLCEMLIYKLVFGSLPWSRALAVSAIANGASVVAGLVLGLS